MRPRWTSLPSLKDPFRSEAMHVFRKASVTLVFTLAAFSLQLAAQETEIPGVTAKIVELRQNNGATRLTILLKNTTQKAATGKALLYQDVVLLDAKTKTKYYPMKDVDGHYLVGPTSD